MKKIPALLIVFVLAAFALTATHVSAQTTPQPDLIVQSFKQLPGGKLELVIGNNGDGAYRYVTTSNANQLRVTIAYYYSSGRLATADSLDYSENFVLSPGGTLGPKTFTLDPRYLNVNSAKVTLDTFQKVAESDESVASNEKKIDLKTPDFDVYEVFISRAANRADARPVVQVINNGSALYERVDGLTANWKWKDAKGDVVGEGTMDIGDQHIPDGGSYKQITIDTGPMPATAIQAVVTVDSTNVYQEYNERNNGGSGYLDVSQFPEEESGEGDLIVEEVTLTPDGKVRAVIANAGTKTVLLPTTSAPVLKFEMLSNGQNSTGIGSTVNNLSTRNGGLIPGQRLEYVYHQVVSYAITKAIVTVDPTGVIDEKKGNNSKEGIFPLPDLTFDPITFDENRNANVRLKNSGERTATLSSGVASVVVEWLDDTGKKIGQAYTNTLSGVSNAQLGPGQSYEFVVSADKIPSTGSIASAKKMIATFVSNTTFFSEKDTGNNTASADMPAVPLPDLELKNLRASGKTISFEIENISQVPFAGTITAENQFEGQAEQLNKSLGDVTITPGQTISKQYILDTIWMGKGSGNLTVTIFPSTQEDKAANNSLSLFYQGEVVVPVAEEIKAETEQAIEATIGSSEGEATPSAKGVDLSGKKAYEKKILPDSPLYIFKEFGRDVQETFTFDKDKKIELVKKYTNEKVLEANALDDKGKKHVAAEHLKSYADDVEKLRKYAEEQKKKDDEDKKSKKKKLKAGDAKESDKELELLSDQLAHQVIINKIETNSDTKDKAVIAQAKNDVLSDVAEVIKDKSPDAIRETVAAKLKVSKGAFSNMHNLETLGVISSNFKDEKNPVVLAKEDTKAYITSTLASLPDKNKTKLKEYVSKSSADVETVQALDELKFVQSDVATKGVVSGAKDLVVTNVARDMKTSREQKTEYADGVLDVLKEGSFDDVRLAAQLEHKSEGSLKTEIESAKKDSAKKFAKTVGALDDKKQRDFLKGEVTNQLDVQQVKLLNDMKGYIPAEDRENIENVIGDVDEVVVTKLETKKTDKSEYTNFVTSFVGDTPEEITYMKKYVTLGGKDFEEDLIKAQVDYFEEYYATITDSDELAQIRKFFNDNDEWASLFEEYSEEDFWEDEPEEYSEDEEEYSEESDEESDEEDTDSDAETTSGCKIVYEPVCGADGYNYDNACEAEASDTTVAYRGECREESSQDEDEEEESYDDEVMGARTKRFYFYSF